MDNNTILHITKRASEMHSARMCRLCLQQKDLVHIAVNHRLVWCFSRILPDDDEFPQFVCAVCQQLIDILYQFNIMGNLTANLMRSYVRDGRNYPRTELIEDELRRAEQSLQQYGKELVGRKSETILKETAIEGSEKQSQKIVKHNKDEQEKKPNVKPERKQSKEYTKSDKFLIGDIVDVKLLPKKNKTASDKTCAKKCTTQRPVSYLESQFNKENIPPTSDNDNLKMKAPLSSSLFSKSTQRFRSLSHRENVQQINDKDTGLQLKGKIRRNSSKVSDKW